VKDNVVMVAGEIMLLGKWITGLSCEALCRTSDLTLSLTTCSSVDSKGLNYQDCEVLVRIKKQSPDIADGVHVGKDDLDVGAGDQGDDRILAVG